MSTSIEWTDETWNPVVGCTKVSEGCRNCYAERLAPRLKTDFSKIVLHPERLETPLHWKKPRRIFVNSLSDLFHEDIPPVFLMSVRDVMKQARWHTFQILTKRAERMLIAAKDLKFSENVWLGVSCEDQKTADERIPLLLQTPAAVRFVSAEPLLGPIDLHRYLSGHEENGVVLGRPAGACVGWTPSLDWAICGGESGPGARPFDIAWARAAIKQCQDAGAPVFMKQLGSRPYSIEQDDFFRWWAVEDHGKKPLPYFARLKDKKGGDPAEWPEDLRVREFPKVSA